MFIKCCIGAFTRAPASFTDLPIEVSTPLMKRLVVNGDDFGYSVQRNKGLVECYKNRSISSTSLLINGVAVDDAVHYIKQLAIPTGLHLNLTEGHPVGKQCDSLMDENKAFLGKHGFRDALQKQQINFLDIYAEIVAQVKLFITKCEQKPTHIDGHQHVHILPGVREVFSTVLQEYGIAWTRLPIELDLDKCTWLSSQTLKTFLKGVVDDAVSSRDVFVKHNIKFTNGYAGLSTMGKALTTDSIMQSLKNITKHNPEACTFEYMVHPGYLTKDVGGCGCGPDGFSRSPARYHEIQVLNDPELKQRLRQCGFELASYKDLDTGAIANGICGH
ncbi:carbohydrate deacetylase-like isoform X2 [Antedon mediterranea]|uniref:carbohydrate deacetylase-like isoform X2 n=1 Tax=Antedon mediterranea TaxID=105859 RepID=UPI003AF6FAFE